MRRYYVLWIMCICLLTGCGKDVGQTSETSMADTTIDVLEMQQESEDTQEADATSEEATTEDTQAQWQEEFAQARRMDYYGRILWGVQNAHALPGGESVDSEGADVSNSKYAIYDIDRDGQDELLLYFLFDEYMNGTARVYDFDPNTGTFITELTEAPQITSYDNGTLTVKLQSNQSLGETVWPFHVYTYDGMTGVYILRGSVETWEKSLAAEDWEGTPFPDDQDADGDGVLYYITDSQGNGSDTPKTKEDYEAWLNTFIGDAAEVEIPWLDVAEENYGSYYNKNKEMFMQRYREKSANYGKDIALQYIEAEDSDAEVENIESLLQDSYGVQMNSEESSGYTFLVTGAMDGVEVYTSGKEGPISFCYEGKKIADVTTCGIYPGMDEDEAKRILEDIGFYWDEYEYVTGKMDGNYYISLETEDGIVQRIWVGYIFTY